MKNKASIYSDCGNKIADCEFNDSCLISETDLQKAGKTISIAVEIPIRDIAGFFHADLIDGPVTQLQWCIKFSGAAQSNYPILTFFSQAAENHATMYLDDMTDDFLCKASMNQRTGMYEVIWTICVRKPYKAFSLYIDTMAGAWTLAYARAMKTLRPEGKPVFPPAAFKPVYCTWYAVHAALSNEYLDRNAKLAAELGCGTFIVDDGWCIDAMKRVTPQTLPTWYDYIGDWEVSEKKLPDFKKHVKYAQSLGLKYLLWVAPFFVGVKSRFNNELTAEELLLRGEACNGYFDPAAKKPVELSLTRLLKVVRDLSLDGLKVDFLDTVPPSLETPRGRETLNYIERLSAGIRSIAGKDALIEFRQQYATPQMLDYATQFRAGDVPFDYLRNLCRMATVRIMLGDAVPIHADPLYWREDEQNLTVARHMIASLAAVPMVSMDLVTLKTEHKAIVSNYLDFYNRHLDTFSKGQWNVRFNGSLPAYLSVTNETERIVLVVDTNWLGDATADFNGICHVLNLGINAVKAAKAFEADGKELDDGIIQPGGFGIL